MRRIDSFTLLEMLFSMILSVLVLSSIFLLLRSQTRLQTQALGEEKRAGESFEMKVFFNRLASEYTIIAGNAGELRLSDGSQVVIQNGVLSWRGEEIMRGTKVKFEIDEKHFSLVYSERDAQSDFRVRIY